MLSQQPLDDVARRAPTEAHGNDRLLAGLVLAVLTFWLFAGSAGSVAPAIMRDINGPYADAARRTWTDPLLGNDAMNLAVALTALFSGMFIVVLGGVADRVGRFRVLLIGLVLSVVGSACLILAAGALAAPLMLVGRAVQGLSAACVLPTTLGLVRACWDGAARQRAVSMWSIASFGGSGLASLVGGFTVTYVGWRWIYAVSIVVAVAAALLLRGQGESKVASSTPFHLDVPGIATFAASMLSLMVVTTFGAKIGWASPITLALAAVAIVGLVLTVVIEGRVRQPFLDLRLFRNRMFSGATLANFLLNTSIGMLIVTQQLLQVAGGMKPLDAGLLTLGYAVTVIAFMRVGERLLRRYGAKKPMLWGTGLLVLAGCAFLPTNLLLSQYHLTAILGYTLMGLGLACFGTPATDAALSNLPVEQSGAGAGIYKMASSLGSAIGTATSLALFTAGSSSPPRVIGSVLVPLGRQDNVGLRQGADVALLFNISLLLLSAVVIWVVVPSHDRSTQTS